MGQLPSVSLDEQIIPSEKLLRTDDTPRRINRTFATPNSGSSNSSGASSPNRLRRIRSSDSADNPWGWFEDCEAQRPPSPLRKTLSLPPAATEPPLYILESSIDTQQLWYSTAGKRPKQPRPEREYYEHVWQQNFAASAVRYSEQSKNDDIPRSEFNGNVVLCGSSPFSNSVSRSFFEFNVHAMTIQVPRYRIFESNDGNVRAEYLVVVSIGGPSKLQFGVWRRHSDFSKLASWMQVESSGALESNDYLYKNSLLSWDCVLQRKRWYQCLNQDYLELKCFLLERFMHDFLYEACSPANVFSFLGL